MTAIAIGIPNKQYPSALRFFTENVPKTKTI
jgi:hypothetical protein